MSKKLEDLTQTIQSTSHKIINETELLKRCQTEIPEIKNTTDYMKIRNEQHEEKVSDTEDR